MSLKLFAAFLLLLLSQPSFCRVLQEETDDMQLDTDGEEHSPSEADPLEDDNMDRELIVRPQNINVTLMQHAFKDTILHLKSEDNIRIRIKVHNQKFLPFFN